MLKKIIIGVLLFTVIGAGGTALAYSIANQDAEAAQTSPNILANQDQVAVSQNENQQAVQSMQGEPNLAVEGAQGEPWKETGTITAIDDF